jgi:hypothetical protein
VDSVTEQEKREKVICGLECCMLSYKDGCDECSYFGKGMCQELLGEHALALLKRSFTPQEVYDTVIEHAQHDMRFKLGDKIDYSFTDVVDILNMELMCKAGDM